MLGIRPAENKDQKAVLRILKEMDLFYIEQPLTDFWVAEKKGKIAGMLRLEEYPAFYFLSSLAVIPSEQGQGIAAALLNKVLKTAKKEVYLYTVIPDLFRKFGFEPVAPIAGLPSKNAYECAYCFPKKCVCMLKRKLS